MKKIFVASKARGFLINLFNTSFHRYKFEYNQQKVYEVKSKYKNILSTIVKTKFVNHIGLIQSLQVNDKDCDYIFSFNRFVNSDKDYVIYLENPTALFHYTLGRNETFLGRRVINKHLYNKHLKAIVCLSKACYNTLDKFYSIPNDVYVDQIYPLVPKNPDTTLESIEKKSYNNTLKCLYISSDFNLKGGREILECYKKLKELGIENITLKVITRKALLDKHILKELEKLPNIEVADFTFSKDQLNKIYNENNILLSPTRQDSFSLVVLEAMKSGNVILSTDLYAIPEMVIDNYNGYLIGPKYRFFYRNNMPNKYVWENRKRTIYSDYIDWEIVNFLFEKITYLYNNRDQLKRLSTNSFEFSNSGEFNEENIKKKWERIFDKFETKTR